MLINANGMCIHKYDILFAMFHSLPCINLNISLPCSNICTSYAMYKLYDSPNGAMLKELKDDFAKL